MQRRNQCQGKDYQSAPEIRSLRIVCTTARAGAAYVKQGRCGEQEDNSRLQFPSPGQIVRAQRLVRMARQAPGEHYGCKRESVESHWHTSSSVGAVSWARITRQNTPFMTMAPEARVRSA